MIIAFMIAVNLAAVAGGGGPRMAVTSHKPPNPKRIAEILKNSYGVQCASQKGALVSTIQYPLPFDIDKLRHTLQQQGYRVSYFTSGMSPDRAVLLTVKDCDTYVELTIKKSEPGRLPQTGAITRPFPEPTPGNAAADKNTCAFSVIVQTGRLAGNSLPDSRYRKSSRSPNRSKSAIAKALQLGIRTVPRHNTSIYAAFPGQPEDALRFGFCGLAGYGTARIVANLERTARECTGRKPEDLTYNALKCELLNNKTDALFLFFHNKDNHIVLKDKSISFDQFQKEFKKSETPERAIFLLTCCQGKVDENQPSLAEIILQNKLARTVFAPQRAISIGEAIELFNLIWKNDGRTLREKLGPEGVIQIVNNGEFRITGGSPVTVNVLIFRQKEGWHG